MKQSLILITAIILFSCKSAKSQKISRNKYKNVDSVLQYDNGCIVAYNGKLDTIYYPQTISVKYPEVMKIYDGEKIKKKLRPRPAPVPCDTLIPGKKYKVPWSANPVTYDSTSTIYNAHIEKFIGLWVYGDTLHSRPKIKFPSNADSVFAAIIGPTGNRYASRDTTGTWRIYNCEKALELMYIEMLRKFSLRSSN